MNSTPVYRILADEEEFLIPWVKWTTDDCVIIGFNVFVVFIFQKPLIDYLLGHFSFIYQHVASSVIDPKTIGTESLLVV
jgi:hypothetical protein